MRIFEIIADKLLESSIFEMALQRKDARDRIKNIQFQLSDHLIKYFSFDDQSKNHWLNEIDGYLSIVDNITLKPNNKKLSPNEYYTMLWDEPLNNGLENLTHRIKKMVRTQYKDCNRSALSDAQVYEAIEKLLHTISFDIANNKFETIRDYI